MARPIGSLVPIAASAATAFIITSDLRSTTSSLVVRGVCGALLGIALVLALSTGQRRLPLVPLLFLPATFLLADELAAWVSAGCIATSILSSSLVGDPSCDVRRSRSFRVALNLALVSFAFLFLARGYSSPGNLDNDSAYYFGMARHLVRTWRWEEPIVWNYLDPPLQAVHAPFSYWGSFTSLVLVPSLAMFGAVLRPALVTLALVSAASLFLFGRLARRVLRTRIAQVAACVLFAWAPVMAVARFDTESTPVYQLVLLTALVAFAERRHVLATFAAVLLVLTRAEGIVFASLIVAASLRATMQPSGRRREAFAVCGVLGASALIVAALDLHFHGAVVPRPVRVVQGLSSYDDLFAMAPHAAPGWLHLLVTRSTPRYVVGRLSILASDLQRTDLVALQGLWIPLAIAPLLFVRRHLSREHWLMLVLLLVGGPVLVCVSPPATFLPDRPLSALVPLVALLGPAGLDCLILRAERAKVSGRATRIAASSMVALVALALCMTVRPYADWRPTRNRDAELVQVGHEVGRSVVLTTHPWQLLASTDAVPVIIPSNGEKAIESAIRRYGAKWIVIGRGLVWPGDSDAIVHGLEHGHRGGIGGLRLSRPRAVGQFLLFRVLPPRS